MRFGVGHGGGPHGRHGARGCGPRGAGVTSVRGVWRDADGSDVGRARGRRMFDGGELRLVLLKLIADQPRHGYDLIREIEALTGGAYAPSPGVVYPTLTLLDEMGLIAEQAAEGAKKQFAVTDQGREHLAEHAEEVAALMARLNEAGRMRQRTDGAPIRRAMGNLRQVLQHRLMREDVGNETLLDVAALIDEAAQKIERL